MSSSLSLPLMGGLDQPNWTRATEMVDKVNHLINEAANNGRPEDAFKLVKGLADANQLTGIGLAVALHRMLVRWHHLSGKEFDTPDDKQRDFEEAIFEKVGKAADTVRRYLMAGELVNFLPFDLAVHSRLKAESKQEILDHIPTRPMQDLIAIAQYVKENGNLTGKQFLELSRAADNSALRSLLRGYRGEETLGDAIQYVVLADGTLEAWNGKGKTVVGFIRNKAEDLTDPLRAKAVARLIKRVGIRED